MSTSESFGNSQTNGNVNGIHKIFTRPKIKHKMGVGRREMEEYVKVMEECGKEGERSVRRKSVCA